MNCLPGILLLLLFIVRSGAQPLPVWQLETTFQGKPMILGKTYYLESLQDSISVDEFRFYVSRLRWLNASGELIETANEFHLFDAADSASQHLQFTAGIPENARYLEFHLGIDSLTQTAGVRGGVLDPSRGMYWAWQSGYIQMKVEGHTPVCHSRKNRFQFHLGGYLPPFQTLQTLRIPIGDRSQVKLHIPMDQLLRVLPLRTLCEVMSPRAEAVQISKQLTRQILNANE